MTNFFFRGICILPNFSPAADSEKEEKMDNDDDDDGEVDVIDDDDTLKASVMVMLSDI